MNPIEEDIETALFNENEYVVQSKKYKLKDTTESRELIKSKSRVQQHGEVFTPKWMVKKMLAEPGIQEKLHNLHTTFLEPSAGEGAFLKEILHQKLSYVSSISKKSTWVENALWALMSIYGIELLQDNLVRARDAMMEIVINHYQAFMQKKLGKQTDFYKAAEFVIKTNIVQGDTLKYITNDGRLIELSHWLPRNNKVKREVFTYKSLFNNSDHDDAEAAFGQLSLFDDVEKTKQKEYVICNVTKVYKEELINE